MKFGSNNPILYLKADDKEVKDLNSEALMVDKIVRIATMEECFEILYLSYVFIGPGRLKKMMAAVSVKYSNIFR